MKFSLTDEDGRFHELECDTEAEFIEYLMIEAATLKHDRETGYRTEHNIQREE